MIVLTCESLSEHPCVVDTGVHAKAPRRVVVVCGITDQEHSALTESIRHTSMDAVVSDEVDIKLRPLVPD